MRDQTRNIETFKVKPARVSRFEFHKHQEEMAEQSGQKSEPGFKATTKKERVAELTKKAHQKVMRKKKRR